MKSIFHKILAKLMGRNINSTPIDVIASQMNERRPLPIGIQEFDEWADRIISGTLLPAEPDSMKFALSTMLLHLGPQEDHREDAYFIHSLRKSAVNQIAHAKMKELKDAAQKRIDDEKLAAEQKAKEIVEPAAEETLNRISTVMDHKQWRKGHQGNPIDEVLADKKV